MVLHQGQTPLAQWHIARAAKALTENLDISGQGTMEQSQLVRPEYGKKILEERKLEKRHQHFCAEAHNTPSLTCEPHVLCTNPNQHSNNFEHSADI